MIRLKYTAQRAVFPEFDVGHKEIIEKIYKEQWSMAYAMAAGACLLCINSLFYALKVLLYCKKILELSLARY